MAKIEVNISIVVDTDVHVEPTPKYEDDPRGFVRGLFDEWNRYGLAEESYVAVFCPQLEPRRVYERAGVNEQVYP